MNSQRTIFPAFTALLMFFGASLSGGAAESAHPWSGVGHLSISSSVASVSQNVGVVSIEVTRRGGSSGTASVLCATRNNTAVSGIDYTAVSQTLDWGSGDTSGKFCNVPISDASPFSGQKTFIVQISDASGAALGRVSSATVTINGSGAGTAGTLTLAAPTYAVAQNAGSVTISVNRTGGSSGAATVAYATANGSAVAGTDYTSEQGALSWASGDATPKTFVIPVSNATPFAGTKTLAVAIASAQGAVLGTANTSAIVSINGDAASPPSVSLSASPTSIASGGSSMLTWSASNATACTASGGWSGSMATSGSQSTGALGAAATYMLGCTGSGGTATQSVTVSISAPTPPTGAVSRPSYNTGNGFFVLNGKLYDANGNEFRFRGVDRAHYDDPAQPGVSNTHANAVRLFVETNYGASVATLVNDVQTQIINYQEVPIVTSPTTTAGTLTSCSNDTSVLNS
ncbi:MAG TPA: Calx-beta domain-containing protein, partial [Steroidobacteraceae bacterium]